MISGVYIVNQKGEKILGRDYRDDVSATAVQAFTNKVIAAKEAGSFAPALMVDGCSFLYIRHESLYFVASTKANLNPALTFQYLYQLRTLIGSYFTKNFDEETVKGNFTLIYELLDESLDFGYPQNCSADILKLYINTGTMKQQLSQPTAQLTSQITGAIDWRSEGLRYKDNELFIDVVESVNLLMSAKGSVLRSEVAGHIQMKSRLSGMPECKLGLNDKLVMDKESSPGSRSLNKKPTKSVEIDDCTFHRCVRLGKFDADRTITFIPPDGSFELMRYRVTENVNLPIQIIPVIKEEGKTRVTINIKVKANFQPQLWASNLVLKIPVPPNTAKCKIPTSCGRAKYDPQQKVIVWRARRFTGRQEVIIAGEVTLAQTTKQKAWSKPPIRAEFQVPMFTASGVQVRFLKVVERSNYEAIKWVRYVTRAGSYQIRV